MRLSHPPGMFVRVTLLLAATGLLVPASLNAQAPAQPSPEVRTLLDQGRAAAGQARQDEALTLFNRALELARERKDRPGEAASLHGLAVTIMYQKPAEARSLAEQALTIYREVGDRTREVLCLQILGNAAQISGEPQKALDLYEASGKLALELGDKLRYGYSLNNTATVYIRTGRPYQAIDILLRSLAIDEELGKKEGIARTYGNLGAAYRNARDLPRALECLEKALALSRELGLTHDEGIVLLNLGLAHTRLTGPQKALESYEQAIPLLEKAGDKRTIAAVFSSMSEAHELAGDLFQSLEVTQRALEMQREVGDRNGIGRSLAHLAAFYEKVGQAEAALDFYRKGLQASREADDLLAQMTTLNHMGHLYGKMGRRSEEQECYDQSLRLHEKNDSFVDARADTLLQLAGSLMRSGKHPQALARSETALVLFRKASDIQGEAFAELRIGDVLERLGQARQARGRYERALKLFQGLGSGPGEAAAAGALGELEESEGRRAQAEQHYTGALARLEESRASLGRLSEAKSGYLEQQIPVYQRYIRFLLQGGQHVRAFEWTQKAKGRVLVDLMDAGKVDVSGAMTETDRAKEQDLKRREKVLSQKWPAAAALVEHLQRQPQPDRTRQEYAKAEADGIRSQQEQMEREWRAFQDQVYVRNPTLAQHRAARVATLDEASAILPADTALLEYCHLNAGQGAGVKDEVALFVVTRESGRARVKVFRSPAGTGALTRMAGDLRQACAGRPGTPAARPYQDVSRRLYRTLIAPGQSALAGKRRLIVCPDGPLWGVPFHALLAPAATSGKADRKAAPFLWERFSIVYGYSGTAVKAALQARTRPNRPRPQRSLLVVADPSFGTAPSPATADTRAGDAPAGDPARSVYLRSGALSALPSTRIEARSIAAAFPDATVKTAGEAQEAFVKRSGAHYRQLHFATHALLNESAPMLSGIVLARPPKDSAEDGILTARELFDMSLAANTVVLSACDTARGAGRRGEGVIGLTWALFVAGSSTQVLSQWAVDDRATADLMGGFYRGLKSGSSKDAALRSSALALLRDGQHQHPFYWAPFLVMGDWR